MQPVRVTGRKMADTWWGTAWDTNLERYSDYENRIGRGRSYLRNGNVLDLRISEGTVKAKVQGSRAKPYTVTVNIKPVSEDRERDILDKCSQRISTVDALASGNIPEDVRDVFVSDRGLFPKPSEISFECTCPDWAHMCKHVAAVLYGIGKRFDDDPLLFFTLRGVDFEPFIARSVDQKLESMLTNAERPSDRIIDGADLKKLFGVLRSLPPDGDHRDRQEEDGRPGDIEHHPGRPEIEPSDAEVETHLRPERRHRLGGSAGEHLGHHIAAESVPEQGRHVAGRYQGPGDLHRIRHGPHRHVDTSQEPDHHAHHGEEPGERTRAPYERHERIHYDRT